MSERIAIVVLTAGGLEIARRIETVLNGAEIHGLAHRVTGADVEFEATGEHLRGLFRDGTVIVGVCAAGVLIRILAGELHDKREEPGVIAVAENGSSVVPLLGGHRGANELARTVADSLDAVAAVTTASDSRWQLALDDPPPGWTLANPQDHAGFVARLMAGESCRIDGQASWLESSDLPIDPTSRLRLVATTHPMRGDEETLVFHPACFALGVGCERNTSSEELASLVVETLAEADIDLRCIAGVFSVDLKADEPAVHTLSKTLDVPCRFFGVPALEAVTPRLATPSTVVFKEVGCHGVAEAAALAAAGREGRLVVEKTKSARATCAVAQASSVLRGSEQGRARGKLTVVGLGPGRNDWRTPAAVQAIREAKHLVGYQGYLEQVVTHRAGQVRHSFPLGEETERVDHALELAAEGQPVVLVCSGDPGVYAMASLAFERVELRDDPGIKRCEVVIVPGVSAMHGAAAVAGAPLGHDFCAISLSDLLTPWAVIERRLQAAAVGDFVVALYNPASGKRRQGLAKAMDILAAHRPPRTPVIVARHVGRDEERIEATTLEQLDQDRIDMMTLLIVGSSQTKRLDERVYTPRGYAIKSTTEQYA